LRARQVELEQQLADAEEYNDHLHEEVHCYTISSTLFFLMRMMTIMMMMRWALESSWLEMTMTLRLMDQRMSRPRRRKMRS
jgi:hypothetical protein